MAEANSVGVLLAGFGGQGVLFTGKFLAYAGMIEGKNVSWLPSYGPEMRGGTANCSVIISDGAVGSPIVSKPETLIAMNLPSFDTFEPKCAPGALVIADSSLIHRKAARGDIRVFYIPASGLAEKNGFPGLANMIMAGKAIRETGLCSYETAPAAMRKVVSERKQKLFDLNLAAVAIGYNYTE
jgi:2-oxoglutarate ferredoxin oxidoreductase subunit gamma